MKEICPPVAMIKPHLRIVHDDTTVDNYYWMYDYFNKGPESDNVIDYLQAENTYTDAVMSDTKELQETLFNEMKNRIKEKDESVPVFKNGYYYYTRTEEGGQYYKYCRKKESLEACEEILLDVDEMAHDKAYYSVVGFHVSEDNSLLAFGVDEWSRRQYTIRIKNIDTGKMLEDEIQNTEGDPCFANDNKTLFYTSKNSTTLLSEKIKRHTLGTGVLTDVVVYEEKDESNFISVAKSKNNKYILIESTSTVSSETRIIDANKPHNIFKVVANRMEDVLYTVYSLENKFIILTNWNAKNFKVMECSLEKTESIYWADIISHRDDVLVESVEEFKDFLVFSERKDGLVQLRIRDSKNKEDQYIEFGEPAYTTHVDENPNYTSHAVRYTYTSLSTPHSVFEYNVDSKETFLLKQQEIIGGYDSSDYVTERVMVTAQDGNSIPVSLVYKKGFIQNGTAQLLLYGYGSYGNSINPSFVSSRLSLLNRGFVFAIAHVRGGQEMGRWWYEDGKMMKKKNTFTDFIDCAEFLIRKKYTIKERLYAEGRSAGGLLMGAVVNMRPDLWKGVITEVPFVDVVNTMLDENIPLTTNEFDEWGNPKNREFYEYMKSYSPYENIEKKPYPHILVTTGLHDSQVQYFEPAKWIAKLRAMKTDKNILLLKTNMEFGHGGASGRFDYLKDIALKYAFLCKLENNL